MAILNHYCDDFKSLLVPLKQVFGPSGKYLVIKAGLTLAIGIKRLINNTKNVILKLLFTSSILNWTFRSFWFVEFILFWRLHCWYKGWISRHNWRLDQWCGGQYTGRLNRNVKSWGYTWLLAWGCHLLATTHLVYSGLG